MKKPFVIILLAGLPLMAYRAFAGLGAVTALTDIQPWGLVKAANIFTGAALAAGSFTVAACVYVLGIKRLKPLVPHALLMGFIGHGFVLTALLYDVGRPLDVWRVVTNPQPHSALLWTAWCEAAYTTVMAVEIFGGARLERLKAPLAVVAAALAVMYQSTLGTLFLASPHRISSLWYSPSLPLQFLLSALAAGIGTLVIATYLADRAGRRVFDIGYIKGAGWTMFALLAGMFALRLGGLFMGGGLTCTLPDCDGPVVRWYVAELGFGVVLPAAMLLSGDVRRRRRGIAGVSVLVIFGVFMNRLGVTIIGWPHPAGVRYFPSALEFLASGYFILAAVTLYWHFDGRLAEKKSTQVEVQTPAVVSGE